MTPLLEGALSGVRVLELAEGVSGPYCGKLLAGMGAEVLKVEPPSGDSSRREGPFPGDLPDPERSGLFLHLNTGKRSVTLDLERPEGRALFRRILQQQQIDILLLGHSNAQLASIGLDLGSLQREFPALIVVDVTLFGLTGPKSGWLGGELIAYAASGYMTLTGTADREPIKAYGSLVEYQTGAHAALGAMAALFAHDYSGAGQLVDVAKAEAGTFLLGGVEQAAYFHGTVIRRNGTRLLGFAAQHSYPSTIRPCRDGYVHAHSNNRHLDLLGALIPHPRLLEPEVLGALFGHADEIDEIMDEWLADKDRRDVVAAAQELRLPFTEVMEPGEVMADEHHRVRGSFVSVAHPGAGSILQPGAPFRMGASPWQTRPAPMLGQDNAEVLAGLGRPADDPPRPRARGVAAVARRPLAGVRIIDFTNAVAGPIATFILADLGAEVIKVEEPSGRPLHAVGAAPLQEGAEDLSYNRIMVFNELNHGKRGVSLNVASERGREVFLKLAAVSDAVIDNFAPRVMPNLRLDYAHLKQVNPGIISVSMPAFGLSGPYKERASYGPGVDAMSGLSHLTGYADGPPSKPGNFFCDQNAGILTAYATMAALRWRSRTGEGQHIEMPMIDGEFQVLGDAYIDFAMNGRERRRVGNDHPWMAPHSVYPALEEDTWVAIAVETDAQWAALCAVIGQPALATDPRFAGSLQRWNNRGEADKILTAFTKDRAHTETERLCQAARVPAAAVLNAKELLADEHVRARDGFEYVDVPSVGPTPYPRVAFRMSGTPVPIAKAAPKFAEDNDYVYRELLGLSNETIRSLHEDQIITSEPVAPGGGRKGH